MVKRDSYSSGEVSKILNLSDRTVRSYLRNGRIPAKQNPHTGRWKISREGLLAFMKQYQMTHEEVGDPPPPTHILVVDAEPALVESIRKIFLEEMPDWVIDTTTSVYEALIRLGAEALDLLILDFCMPGTDGYKILEAVRTNEQTAAVKVLVVTGTVEKIDDLIARGADAFIEKPCSAEDLLAAARELLAKPCAGPA